MNCSKCNNTGWIFYTDQNGYETASISHRDISLTALNTAYRCLDETLKEFL